MEPASIDVTEPRTEIESEAPAAGSAHTREVAAGARFEFGVNWSEFIARLNNGRVRAAQQSLVSRLRLPELAGRRFLDAGSGSGLFSLAARRLGAEVVSFDYDPACVACTRELRKRYRPEDRGWDVLHGSLLDEPFLQTLGRFDVVYSWGVLHHTGALWRALSHLIPLVRPGGLLFVAVYNDQGRWSRGWLRVKRAYNRLPPRLRWLVLGPVLIRLWGPTMLRDLFHGRPFATWKSYGESATRGMSPWHDVVDWAGGLPFEVARPEDVFAFCRDRAFTLVNLKTCAGGKGCNEFVFRKELPADSVQRSAGIPGPDR